MKKLIIPAAAICLFFSACSNQGAFTQKEKDSMDNVDTVGREDKFKALESPTDSGNSVENKTDNGNSEKNNSQDPKASVPKSNGGAEPLQKTK